MQATSKPGVILLLIFMAASLTTSSYALTSKAGFKRIATSSFTPSHGEIKEVPGFDGPLPSK